MRSDVSPVPPSNLSAYAREVLELMAGDAAAAEIVLGGGVALAHYLEYRDTFDLDAWWASAPTNAARELMSRAVQMVADRHGLVASRRSWGETESFELSAGPRKVFSLQIAARDRYLDETAVAAWPPVRIETLRDNVASKMTALVERGAPRDLRDIHQLCLHGLITIDDCWNHRAKHPTHDIREAAGKVLHAVERLEAQRPLSAIASDAERSEAATVRKWYREGLCRHGIA
jgi:hypothetical protein